MNLGRAASLEGTLEQRLVDWTESKMLIWWGSHLEQTSLVTWCQIRFLEMIQWWRSLFEKKQRWVLEWCTVWWRTRYLNNNVVLLLQNINFDPAKYQIMVIYSWQSKNMTHRTKNLGSMCLRILQEAQNNGSLSLSQKRGQVRTVYSEFLFLSRNVIVCCWLLEHKELKYLWRLNVKISSITILSRTPSGCRSTSNIW